MKLTNGEIFNAKQPLEELLKEKFPVKVSYGLAKIAVKIDEQLKVIDQVRQGLVKTYGEAADDGTITVKPNTEGMPKFLEEYGELMRQEVEIVFDVVTLPDTVTVTPAVLMALDKFVKVS